MRFFRRIAGFLGFAKDEVHEPREEDEDDANVDRVEAPHHLPRKGFSVPVQVPVERAPVGPLIVACSAGDGGVQGLRWYAKRLRIDEDGDVADEFLNEVVPETISTMTDNHHRQLPKFEVKYSTRPANVRSQALSSDGKIRQCVEYKGRLLLA